MGYKLYASIVWEKNKAELKKEPEPKGGSKEIKSLESVGIRFGDEIAKNSKEGILNKIACSFKNMKRPSPIILTWDPPDNEKSFFRGMKGRKINITIGVAKDDDSASWSLTFRNVEIYNVGGNKKLEKIDATFEDFHSHPELC